MKRALGLAAVALLVPACTTLVHDARYEIGLVGVARDQRGGELKRFTDVSGHTFEDEFIRVTWTPFDTQLGLILRNKTDSTQRIVWDEISYVSLDGKSDHVVHEGVKIDDGGRISMPPTVVLPGHTLLDLLEPVAHIHWRKDSGRYDTPLIGYTSATTESEVRAKMAHGIIKVLLPIDTNGTIRNYLFEFRVRGSVVLRGWSS